MATLDIFNDDAFSVTSLSQTIVDIPEVPTRLGDRGLFTEYGISTLNFMIERQGSALKLLPTAPRGGVREPVSLGKRKLITLQAQHIPASWSVLADEVQGVRAFGSETEVDQVSKLVARKLAVLRGSMDLTLEYHRLGALKGQVLDADGSLILDVYSAFGMTQEVIDTDLDNQANVDPKTFIFNLKAAMKSKLGGRSFSRIRVMCSMSFFTKLISAEKMKKAWELYNQNAFARTDQIAAGDFEWMGVIFEIYDGSIGGVDLIEEDTAYAYPEGVPGMFQTAFAPADYIETVNTEGQAFYAKQELMKFGKGIEGEAQSNPLTFNSLPEAVLKLTTDAP